MDPSIPVFPEYARKSVEVAARRLIREGGFRPEDFDDIRSEITTYALRQLRRHDVRMARLTTFVSMVVRDAANSLLRRRSVRRSWYPAGAASLEADTGCDEDGVETALVNLLDGDDTSIGMGYRRRSRHEEAMLRLDVDAVVSLLPDNLRACCAAIMDGRSISDLARESGMPHSTFRDCFIAPIRHAFEEAGMNGRV